METATHTRQEPTEVDDDDEDDEETLKDINEEGEEEEDEDGEEELCAEGEEDEEEEEERDEECEDDEGAAAPLVAMKRPAAALGRQSALALAAAKAEAGFEGNSGTHAAEYKEFLRKIKGAAKADAFPIACAEQFATKKADMFKVFMDNGKNITATLDMIVRRTLKKEKVAEEKFIWKKKRQFCENYGETIDPLNPTASLTPKTDKVCARLTKASGQHVGSASLNNSEPIGAHPNSPCCNGHPNNTELGNRCWIMICL
jgi:hypothetical protein